LLTVPFLFSSQFDSQEDTASAGDQPQMVVDRLTALDGLRGFAAIMVIADHTWGWFRGVGASGVWIFFALSGFLLARPFISNPRRALSVTYMSQYIRRRFLRILPMYYVYIFVVFAISGRFNHALMHCLFLQGDGHLWAIPQEVIFYLLWPLVVILIFVPLRQFPRLSLIILLILIISWNRFIGIENFWLLGMNHIKLPLFFGVFLTGAFFSFVYSLLSPFLLNISCRYKLLFGKLASSLGLLLLLFFVLLSTGHILGEKIIYSQMYFGTYGFFAGAVILCALLAKGHALHDFLSIAPLRAIGTVGFSLYLVHPLVKRMVEDFSLLLFNEKIISFPLFLATFSASYFLAQFTYRYIEKPVYDKGLAPDRSANQVISAVRPTATAFNPASIPPPHSLVHKEK
jgi:peptidoglycan/LPS O-acetylase OafA/YrhL